MRENNLQGKDLRKKSVGENGLHENRGQESLTRELKEKLDWYIAEASEEEYDEKAVEYILYLLDTLEPWAVDKMPRTDEAWHDFRVLVQKRQQAMSKESSREEGVRDGGTQGEAGRDGAVQGKAVLGGIVQSQGNFSAKKAMELKISFILRHKIVAVAVLTLLVLAAGGTARTIARKDTGFFQWLKQDNTGKQMITSPESLDDVTEAKDNIFYSEDDMPEWTQEWLQIINKLEIPSEFEWKRFETYTIDGLQSMASYYFQQGTGREFAFGMKLFFDKISYSSGVFDDYVYVDDYEGDTGHWEIYEKTEESGNISYIIYFIEKNCEYFILGQEDLEELKDLAELYWKCIKNNL